jgi:hypothetical protein
MRLQVRQRDAEGIAAILLGAAVALFHQNRFPALIGIGFGADRDGPRRRFHEDEELEPRGKTPMAPARIGASQWVSTPASNSARTI